MAQLLSEHQIQLLNQFSDCLVEHTQVKQIFEDFDQLRASRLFHSDPQCMLLTGDTGVGKSHLINHYQKRVASSQTASRTSHPILVSRIASGKSIDHTFAQILSDLELFGSHRRTVQRGLQRDLRKDIVKCLINANVELLIINEFQEVIEFKSPQERQLIANALKYLSEAAKLPIVLVGMPWADKIADEPQWSSRLIRRRQLSYFDITTDEAQKYFRRYLKGLANHMPLEIKPAIEQAQFAIPLFAASKGENRILKHLLTEALRHALLHNSSALEREHFIAAHDSLFGPSQSNPFREAPDKVKFSRVAKASYYNPNALSQDDLIVSRQYTEAKRTLQEWIAIT
ncbi:TniB family NTP-binding protein [Shewanella sp. 4t3-1-2LB]|uniref:TniB family NTP-binding protein n=1 Tax=Shewanella sp. 4t3-1-2LB TaxID=2817682 RepID=UPI001A98ED51|nr:TniB family NTP-binding protein [Shewanella sp. 4t3-1-2LB]MBO1272488.1 TniB family NTP-binding protein [Shewanella sp. 4t3-1-2LB]